MPLSTHLVQSGLSSPGIPEGRGRGGVRVPDPLSYSGGMVKVDRSTGTPVGGGVTERGPGTGVWGETDRGTTGRTSVVPDDRLGLVCFVSTGSGVRSPRWSTDPVDEPQGGLGGSSGSFLVGVEVRLGSVSHP